MPVSYPVWAAWAALAWVAIFQCVGWGLWRALWRGSNPGRLVPCVPALLGLFFQQALGMGGIMILLLVVAVAGIFDGFWLTVVLVLCCAPVAFVACRDRRGLRERGASGERVVAWQWWVMGCAALLSVAVSWRFPGAWDDTAYHLPMARTFVEQHALAANEWLRFPYFPAYMHLLFAAGLLVDVWLAQWLATWPVVVLLAGLMGAAQWLGRHCAWGAVAWVVFVLSPPLGHSLGFAFVDAGLAMFCTTAVLAMALWVQSGEWGRFEWVIFAGGCAGMAAGIKFHGLVVAAALAVAMMAVSAMGRRAPLAVLRCVVVYGLACVAVGGFWYLRSFVVTGDPIHPAGGAMFGYYLWTRQDLALQVAEQASHGLAKQWAFFIPAIWHAGVPFVYAIFGLPLMLLDARARAWSVVGLVVWANVLFWFYASQVDRYLVPVLPLAALFCIGVACRGVALIAVGARGHAGSWTTRCVAWPWREGLAVLCVTCVAAWSVKQWLQRPSMKEQQSGFGEIALLRKASQEAPRYGRRVLDMGYENAFFYYDGQMVGDWFGRAAFPRIADCSDICRMPDAEKLRAIMHELNVRMVLIHSVKFPFDRTQYSAHMHLLADDGVGFLYGLKAGE